ncbi:MAG: hypothetical protein D3903_13165, partial [Candidatus Electrothrix sp. GM3_4]|nr:hypothetical protein [Candidatus Electrothrix sp. GM3_4]
MIFPNFLAVCPVCAGIAVFFLLSLSSSGSAHINEQAENTVRSIPATDMLPLQKNLFWLLENKPSVKFSFIIDRKAADGLDALLYTFYQENAFFPYWVTEYGLT